MADDENFQDSGTDSFDSGTQQEGNPPTEQTTQANEFSIPDEYKDKGWAQFFNGKTGDELKTEFFKSYDNSQSLIGKKVEDYLTTTDLKQLANYEDIKKNLSTQLIPEYNVPENSNEYDLQSIVKENLGEETTFDYSSLDKFQNDFKEFGISKEQGQKILKSYIDYQIDEFQKMTNAEELETNINSMFKGNSEQRTKCEALIKEFLPTQDQKFIQETMPNQVVEMFYKITKGLLDKYDYQEGNSGSGQSSMRMTQQEKDAEYTRITNELEALTNRPHRAQEKQELLNQLQALYK